MNIILLIATLDSQGAAFSSFVALSTRSTEFSSTFLNKRRKQKADLHPGSTVILFLSFTEREEVEADLSPGSTVVALSS
jgi:hypothetical protein